MALPLAYPDSHPHDIGGRICLCFLQNKVKLFLGEGSKEALILLVRHPASDRLEIRLEAQQLGLFCAHEVVVKGINQLLDFQYTSDNTKITIK
jgi:hypothetical protein